MLFNMMEISHFQINGRNGQNGQPNKFKILQTILTFRKTTGKSMHMCVSLRLFMWCVKTRNTKKKKKEHWTSARNACAKGGNCFVYLNFPFNAFPFNENDSCCFDMRSEPKYQIKLWMASNDWWNIFYPNKWKYYQWRLSVLDILKISFFFWQNAY